MNTLVEKALSLYGTAYNPEYARRCCVSIPPKANWCGVFCGYLLAEIGCDLPARPQVARSYLKVGKPVDKPKMGDLVVFWRVDPKDWRGHVGLFIRTDGSGVYCLGGNQSGRVQVTKYSELKILGYRRIEDEF